MAGLALIIGFWSLWLLAPVTVAGADDSRRLLTQVSTSQPISIGMESLPPVNAQTSGYLCAVTFEGSEGMTKNLLTKLETLMKKFATDTMKFAAILEGSKIASVSVFNGLMAEKAADVLCAHAKNGTFLRKTMPSLIVKDTFAFSISGLDSTSLGKRAVWNWWNIVGCFKSYADAAQCLLYWGGEELCKQASKVSDKYYGSTMRSACKFAYKICYYYSNKKWNPRVQTCCQRGWAWDCWYCCQRYSDPNRTPDSMCNKC
jgi:hypothetical protein